ncbi:hypothetical protein BJP34_23825 [Moorena producens PAL-8-15-08-1]|uniref:Uncharacterized protein n=1 Tax=Moorena producens PAL-8-15-08-1 TaxID=1458985 RepID=A0A1D8TWM9_9CYAN|nr:hypothetical protein [Moorena producens]AOX02060.1 hypothetical protein BJP34_23825 [Moorena producens PAL-8-15-08-1]
METGFSHPTSYSGWWALLRSIPAGLGVGFKQCPPYKMLWLVGIAQINSGRIGSWFQAMPTLQKRKLNQTRILGWVLLSKFNIS